MESITNFYYRYLRYIQSKDDSTATPNDKYMALSYAVRSQMVSKWIETQKRYRVNNTKRIYYLSMEYIFGKSLKHNIINLGLEKNSTEAAQNLDFSLEELYEQEDDFELGNGALGRIAACFQDSMASLGIPAMGYGLHYDYALFKQRINEGIQTEQPYDWLNKGHPWEIKRPEYACNVGFYGEVNSVASAGGNKKAHWIPSDNIIAVPLDFPVSGYANDTVNTLRLWSAQASEEFLPDYQNHGDYIRACEEKFRTGRITKCLLPEEDVLRVTDIRIKQQYFFISASLKDIIRRYKRSNSDILNLDQKVVIHLNDSRCAIAIVELMRLLIDNENVSWDDAWRITKNVFTYTIHAVSHDNLEKWPVYLLKEIIPRHAQIINEINQWHLDNIGKKLKLNKNLIRELSIIEEGEVKWVRMAYLAILGSLHVNGISETQTDILENKIFPSFSKYLSVKFKNKTNGIELRRWLLCDNKPLSGLISEMIGSAWIKDYKCLEKLEKFDRDSEFLARLGDIKHAAKRHFVSFFKKSLGIDLDSNSFFDINCNKIHLYKRQLLHILYIVSLYLQIKHGKEIGIQRTHIFGGRAAPTDFLAKKVIHLIHVIAEIIDKDPQARKKTQVVFIPNYGVSLSEYVIPTADLSEQIATPNYEACGTTNMKFAINGAITIASKCGSNIEMIEEIGVDNIVVFGHNGKELDAIQNYNPTEIIDSNETLKSIFAFFDEVLPSFPKGDSINPLLVSLKENDPYFVLLDFDDYIKKQNSVNELYKDRSRWLSMSLKNIIRTGWFSSDRVVNEYSRDIWGV